jgi:hypothetical protein
MKHRSASSSNARAHLRIPIVSIMAFAIVAASAVAASADVVTNTLDTSPDRQLEKMSLQAGKADGSTAIVVLPQGGDGDPLCNIDPGETLTLSVISINPTVATVSPEQLSFTGCNAPSPVTVHAVAGGSSEISVTIAFNNTGAGLYQNDANFAIVVTPADPGAPMLATGSSPNNTGAYTLNWAASAVGDVPYTWGFVGCSNTHDTLWGYHDVSAKHMFWPASFGADGDPHNVGAYDYSIEGQTIHKWSDPTLNEFGRDWAAFDRMKSTYDGGQDPPVVWVELCENINPHTTEGTYHVSDYSEVQALLATLRQHAPTSKVYISPLQSYAVNADGTLVCTVMNGEAPGPTNAVDEGTAFATQAVADGLALAGPGANGVPNLGPLTFDPPYIDVNDPSACHPNGNPKHGVGPGSDFLGAQLAAFFDPLAQGSPNDTLTYTLYQQDANDQTTTIVATGLTTNSYTFAVPAAAVEGTWTYFAQAVATTIDPDFVLPSSLSPGSAPIVVDQSAPAAPTLSAPGFDFAGNGGWYKDTVTVTSLDNGDPLLADGSPGSGVDPSSVGPAGTFTTSGPHTATDTVLDLATNESAPASLVVQVDADGPSVAITCPAPLTLGSAGAASWSASDAESGLATDAAGSVALDASAIGPHTANAPSATDNVGHQSSASCSYSVIWNFSGFFQPVDNPDVLNVAKAGSAIPVKFSLAGDQGLDILAANSPTTSKIDCGDLTDLDSIETTVNAGQSSLSYDPVAGQYVYVWKTDKAWSSSCRQLSVTLADGTTHIAYFKFTK